MSGKRLLVAAIVAAGALVLVGTACGADDSVPANSSPSAPAGTVTADQLPIDVQLGAPLGSEQATHFLPLLSGRRQSQPVAAYGEQFLLSESDGGRATTGVQTFALWDPVTGDRSYAWASETGAQDIVTGVAGDLAIFVRTGLSLPFANWRIQSHNLLTGESRTIASAEPGVAETPGLSPGPPFGFAPYPAVSGGRLAWVEFRADGTALQRQVRIHDLATEETWTAAIADVASGEDLASATLGGDRAAWVRWSDEGVASIEVHDLLTGATTALSLDARPYAIALDGSGTTLAWDDARGGKYAVALDGGAPRRFAGDEGWGITVSGGRFAWAPGAAYGGTGGYYDIVSNELRLLTRRTGVFVNQATVLGDWFAWLEVHSGTSGAAGDALSGYHFMKLDPS